MDEHCCPLRSIRISNGKQKDTAGSYTPILTSKGRSLLGIALGNRNIGIARYLVVEKRMLLAAEKGLGVETLAQNLDLVLRVLPEEVIGEQAFDQSERQATMEAAYSSGIGEQESDLVAISASGGMEDGASSATLDDEVSPDARYLVDTNQQSSRQYCFSLLCYA